MNKYIKWATGGALLTAVLTVTLVSVAYAQRFSRTVDQDETVNSSLYSAGKVVAVNGIINGDVFCAGETITIDAEVHGDVICAGSDVTIAGKVDGDVRVAGQTVVIEADVTDSVTIAAQSFSLDANATVGRDLTAMGDTLNIKGAVLRDVLASGNVGTLNGSIGRNVRFDGNKLVLKSNAAVAGTVDYTSKNKIDVAAGAVVAGTTKQTVPEKSNDSSVLTRLTTWLYIFTLAGLILITSALAFFFPRLLVRTSDRIRTKFGITLLVGASATLVVPMLLVGLAVTVVGIPLALFLFLAWIFAFALSGPIVSYYVGSLVLSKRTKQQVWIALAGSLALGLLYFLPFIGTLLFMVASWLGLGALLLTLQPYVRQRDKKM